MVEFYLLFQFSKVLIQVLLPESIRFLRFLGDAFLKPQCMREVNLRNIDIENDDNLLSFEEIDIDYNGNTKQTIQELKNDSDVKVEDITEFYMTIQKFYKVAYKGAVTRLLFNKEFLKSLGFLNLVTAIYIENHKDQLQNV